MNWRSIIGRIGVVAALGLVCVPQAQARDSAKFKVLSISGTTTSARDVIYEPSPYGDTCAFTQTERVSFHSTRRATAYAFTSKAHGRARVAWSSKPTFSGNFTVVEVPGEVTISRSATYEQSTYVDPDTGETYPGCIYEPSPVDCAVKRTLPATLNIGGTSASEKSTYVEMSANQGALNEIDNACLVELFQIAAEDPGLFSRADLFKGKPKRLSDTDRAETPAFDNATDDASVTGTTVKELTAELKRKKQRPKGSG